MKKTLLILLALVLLACLIVFGMLRNQPVADAAAAAVPAATPSPTPRTPAAEEAHPSFLYGRVTAVGGATFEGRLRWGEGGTQEAFWGDYFNGSKKENPWAAYVPAERLPRERYPIEILGIEIMRRERPMNLGRFFMARFGDITRLEGGLNDVRVTLKNGTVVDLNRNAASDFDDGVRVWDTRRGAVDLDSRQIQIIELLPTPRSGAAPNRLHGTVRTGHGDFTGFVQWDREEGVGSDELDGFAGDREHDVRFDTIRSIARHSSDSSLVTLLDGREVVLSGTNEGGQYNHGVYVDDPRYGRVLVSWDAFERLDFSSGAGNGSGPAYGDFPPGGPLTGSVTTRDGRRLAGRLVFDLDESEITETIDAPSRGVDYTLPAGLIASVVLPAGEEAARVTLHSGEELQLERAGDLGQGNAGLLVFADGAQRPEYVPWPDVERVEFDRPPAMYPALGEATRSPGSDRLAVAGSSGKGA